MLPGAGVPEISPVAASKVTPAGRVSPGSSVSTGVGVPVAVTVNVVPATPSAKETWSALVIDGAWVKGFTVRVKLWVASMP